MANQCNQPEAQHPPSQGLRLDTIAEDCLHIIAAELVNLSHPSIFAMAQSSRILRQVALPFVYQDVVLYREGDESKTSKAYEALVELFRGRGESSIARHVRHLVVKDELPTDDLMMILDTISEFGFLRKLSWETTAHMPPLVLDKLRKTWPDLQLSVHVLARGSATTKSGHRKMDEKLLSSPLLTSLTYEVIYKEYKGDRLPSFEWAKITRAIHVGGCLRILRLQIRPGGRDPEYDSQFELFGDLPLPELEEITLHNAYEYNVTDEYCRMLANSVGMSKLHTLNFADGISTPFCEAFTGRLPDLKTLRVKIQRNVEVEITADFIKSLKRLESLDINGSLSVIDALWPAIMQHGATLKNLQLRQHIEIGRLEEVVNSFPSLERLGWYVRYENRADYLGLISRINLERLDLFLVLPDTANDYCGELIEEGMGAMRSPPLDKKLSQATAVKMMQDLAASSGHWLERLTLHLTRVTYYDRTDPRILCAKLQVRREKRAGTQDHFEFRGKQAWTTNKQMEEDLEPEWPDVFSVPRPRTRFTAV